MSRLKPVSAALSVSPLPFGVMSPVCPTDVDVDVIVGEWLRSDDDVEYCCGKLFRSEVFLKNSDKVRYELISIANEVCSVFSCIPSEYRCVREVASRVLVDG